MTKAKPDSDFILVRPEFCKTPDGGTRFSILRNNEKLDLTDLVYLKTLDNGIEEWVHKNVYQFYYDLMHKYDALEEWIGTEDHKEFLEGAKE
jgi:hypothetical protein